MVGFREKQPECVGYLRIVIGIREKISLLLKKLGAVLRVVSDG